MVKRFTPRASDYTATLADVQARIAKLRKEMKELEATEAALKSYCMGYFEEGATDVDYGDKTLHVTFNVTSRRYLDQDKAKAMILAAGKKIPLIKTKVVHFSVKGSK